MEKVTLRKEDSLYSGREVWNDMLCVKNDKW